MIRIVRPGRMRAIALAGAMAWMTGAFAQEAETPTAAAPAWLEPVLQSLSRLEAEQQALRREIEELRALQQGRPDPDPDPEPSTEPPTPESSPERAVTAEAAAPDADESAPEPEAASQVEEEPATNQEDTEDISTVPEDASEAAAESAAAPESGDAVADEGAAEGRLWISRPAVKLYEQGREEFRELRFYDAAKTFREFTQKYPTHKDISEARYWLGEALHIEGQYKEAIEVFAEVIADETSTRREMARLKTGYAWFELGEFEQAKTMLIQVRDKNPDSNLARLAQLRLERIRNRTDAE